MLRQCIFFIYIIAVPMLSIISETSTESTTSTANQDNPVVLTKYGRIRGNRKTDTYLGKTYEEYLGIPFATPPVGSKRWKKPEPPTPWDGVRNTTSHGSHCVHILAAIYEFINITTDSSEDCLYLNVYVPGHASPNRTLPVMFWIYGGAYLMGTAQIYPGMQLALRGDVIVVTVNYRLGVIGFLSTGDKTAPGNYGLWDINLAMRWVKDNIKEFGGDPTKVTVFGESAGAHATSTILLSPYSKGLMSKAIEQSGSSFGTEPANENHRQAIRSLAGWFMCDWSDDLNDVIECLKEEDALDLDLWSIIDAGGVSQNSRPIYSPVVDGDFLPNRPMVLYKAGAAKDIPIMTGSNYHDAAALVFFNPIGLKLNGTLNLAANKTALDQYMWSLLETVSDKNRTFAQMKTFYPDLDSDDLTTRTKAATHALTDWSYGSSSYLESKIHSTYAEQGIGTFKYIFKYRQDFLEYLPWVNGSHMDDIYSVLGPVFMETFRERWLEKSDFSPDDMRMMDTVMKYWTNFAKYGDPSKGEPVQVRWPGYIEGINQYLELTKTMSVKSVRALNENQRKKYDFWLDIKFKENNIHENHVPVIYQYSENDIDDAEVRALSMVDSFSCLSAEYSVVADQLKSKISKVASKLRTRRASLRA